MAYNASRTLSMLVVRAAGYRPRTVGAHYNTFLAVETADPAFAAISAYFDGCRMKRNSCEYDFAGAVSDTDAEGLLTAVRAGNINDSTEFQSVTEELSTHYRQLAESCDHITLVFDKGNK
jgi:hypothetical protein